MTAMSDAPASRSNVQALSALCLADLGSLFFGAALDDGHVVFTVAGVWIYRVFVEAGGDWGHVDGYCTPSGEEVDVEDAGLVTEYLPCGELWAAFQKAVK